MTRPTKGPAPAPRVIRSTVSERVAVFGSPPPPSIPIKSLRMLRPGRASSPASSREVAAVTSPETSTGCFLSLPSMRDPISGAVALL